MSIWKTIERVGSALWRGLKFILKWGLRGFVVLFMVLYVIMGTGGVQSIVERELNKIRDAEYLETVIEEAVFKNKLEDISMWIRRRPLEDTKPMLHIVVEHSSDLPAVVFFDMAGRLAKMGHRQESLFWYLFGRYRLRYDLLRCGASEGIAQLDGLINMMEPKAFRDLQQDQVLMREGIRKVLELDEAHPPENTIEYACAMLQITQQTNAVPVPEENWEPIRQVLRDAAKGFVGQK